MDLSSSSGFGWVSIPFFKGLWRDIAKISPVDNFNPGFVKSGIIRMMLREGDR